MKICVIGSGAIGSSIGGVLSEGGLEVYLIDPWAEHVNAMNRHGLRITEGGSERVVKVRAATDCRGIGTADLVLVLVKSFYTRDAIESAAPLLDKHTMVLSLQNGLGNEDTLIDVVGKERVLGGRTYAGGVLVGPGKVITGRKGKPTFVGELDGTSTARVDEVAREFTRAGLETTVSTNIVGMMWDKLLINVATGPLCGITGLTFGGLRQAEEIKACALEAISETIAVARAAGVQLAIDDPEAIWTKAHAGLPEDFKPSLLQDIEKGARTEIDFISGSVVRAGERANIPTPVNRTLVAGVKGIELRLQSARMSGRKS